MKSNFDSFHGTILRSSEVAGLTLTETAYAPNLGLPYHLHQWSYFCFVLQGGFTETYGKRSRDCSSSSLIFHPAGETHSDCFHAKSRCFNLKIDAQWLDKIRDRKAALTEPADFRNGILLRLTTRLYKEFCNPDELSSLVIEGLTLEILAETSRHALKDRAQQQPRPPYWLAQARELLRDRFCENLSLASVAQAVGVHETHLSREFRRYYGCTVGEYVRHLRIEYTCRQLSASNASLAEIALAAGFFDQSHFARNFKSQTGMTPHEYRRLWQSR